jgi:ATP-dependent DNA ligase
MHDAASGGRLVEGRDEADNVEGANGEALLGKAWAMGLEGIVSQRTGEPYQPEPFPDGARSSAWIR